MTFLEAIKNFEEFGFSDISSPAYIEDFKKEILIIMIPATYIYDTTIDDYTKKRDQRMLNCNYYINLKIKMREKT